MHLLLVKSKIFGVGFIQKLARIIGQAMALLAYPAPTPLTCQFDCVLSVGDMLNVFTIGDSSASSNTHEEEIDERLQQALSMEDPDILVDLCHLNNNESDRYEVFWKQCEAFLQKCTSVHERRHGNTKRSCLSMLLMPSIHSTDKWPYKTFAVPVHLWQQS